MKKWLKTLLSLNSLRKKLDNDLFFRAAEFNYHIEILPELEATSQKILVLAPHPDDDCFGLGGTIKKITQAGGQVTVAYFCDGSGGTEEIRNKKKEISSKDLISIRKEEAKKTKEILGIFEQIFYAYPDGKLSNSVTAQKALISLINKTRPDIIFLPSMIDNHPDHRAVNDILASVIKTVNLTFQVWQYEVWTPLSPNRIVLINHELKDKEEAMVAHQSQLATRGYAQAIFGLNQYRAEMNNQAGFAEAFFSATPEIYLKMYQIVNNK